jgi:hypothetical protein
MQSPPSIRLSICTLIFTGIALLAGCSWIKVKDVPSPYEEGMVLDKVIKEIRIEGNETTRESIIRTAMASKEGDVYTEEKAILDGRRLYGLGVFISIHFDTIEEEDGVILLVEVQEVSPYIPAPSIKITEENGLEVGATGGGSHQCRREIQGPLAAGAHPVPWGDTDRIRAYGAQKQGVGF